MHNLMTTAQAARVLQVSRSTLSRWADAGRLPVAHRGTGRNGPMLFEARDVEALAEKIAQARADRYGSGLIETRRAS